MMTSIVGKCDQALWKSITNNRTTLPWVTQQQLQYTPGGRSTACSRRKRHDPKKLREKQKTCPCEEKCLWRKSHSARDGGWAAFIHLNAADGPSSMLTVIERAVTGTMDYCSTLSLQALTELIFFFPSIPRNTVYLNDANRRLGLTQTCVNNSSCRLNKSPGALKKTNIDPGMKWFLWRVVPFVQISSFHQKQNKHY